jgi:hypothetical protein
MAKSPTLTLTCKQCRYVNEPERVYCHNCGSKLDRSVLPKEEEVRRESPEKAQRRIKKMTNPGANPVLREGKSFVKTIALAIVAAGLIQMVREPADTPPEKGELTTRFVSSELMDLVNFPQPRAIAFSGADLNAALKQMAKPGKDAVVAKFDRAYVNLYPGQARLSMQQSFWGFPLHAGIGFQPEFKNGEFKPTIVSGNIGRLPVHPELMSYVSYAFPPFRKLQKGAKRDLEYLQKMQLIRVEKDRIILQSRGATPAAAPTATPAATPSSSPQR